MGNISRRDFLAMAAVLGAEAAWGRSFSTPSKISWRERRDLFPEGVASGDPDSNSVLLWTRRAPQPKPAQELDRRSGARPDVPACDRNSESVDFGGGGLDLSCAGRRTEAGPGLLVSLYRS